MSDKLAHALHHARHGLPCFPLIPNAKTPLIKDFNTKATVDPLDLAILWQDNLDANVAIQTERFAVIDIDPRNGGDATFEAVAMVEDIPETVAARTQGGGTHLYFRLPDHVFVKGKPDALGRGVDIKSHGGYVVAPGSMIDGRTYEWLPGRSPDEIEIAEIPPWLLERLSAPEPRSKLAGKRVADEDEAAIEAAKQWLDAKAPEAVEGERDNTAFRVAAKFYDFGLTPETTRELLAQWNEEYCHPPLDDPDLDRLVESAARNRQTAIGAKHPMAPGFDAYELPEGRKERPPQAQEQAKGPRSATAVTPFDFDALPPRPWVIPNFACRNTVTLFPGAAGAAKSTYLLAVAVATATGRGEICGRREIVRSRVWLWNQEDDARELRRRLAALMRAFDVSWNDLDDERGEPMLYIDSGVDLPLLVARRTSEHAVAKGQDVAAVIEEIRRRDIGLAIFDPLQEFHEAGENDNTQMRAVMSLFRDIAVGGNCAVIVVAHTGKPPKASSKSYAGDPDVYRGASSQGGVVRLVETLFGAAAEDAKEWALPGPASDFVRLDQGKNNLGPKRKTPLWFRFETVLIGNDPVGLLRPIEVQKRVRTETDLAQLLARTIAERLPRGVFLTGPDVIEAMADEEKILFGSKPNWARVLKTVFEDTEEIVTDYGKLSTRPTTSRGAYFRIRLSDETWPGASSGDEL